MRNNSRLLTFKRFRIVLLLIVLISVAVLTSRQKQALVEWQTALPVTIYPINGDRSTYVASFISEIKNRDYAEIKSFMEREAQLYDIDTVPLLDIQHGKELATKPPSPPSDQFDKLAIMLWSLKLRFWMFRHTTSFGLGLPHIRVFVLYHEGEDNIALKHSYGLKKGLIGVVHAFAHSNQIKQNNIVITHELLHTLGATDKYDQQGQPLYPIGYADRNSYPIFPQTMAEIMAGRTPINQVEAVIPDSLNDCVIGPETAAEIAWY